MRDRRPFFDTNILIYAIANDDPRAGIAEALLSGGGIIGVQTLNEFVAVAMHKLHMQWEEILEVLGVFGVLCPSPVPVTLETHRRAQRITEDFGYGIYDSLVIAAALEASCTTLYSEDLQDRQVIEGLTIRNPFSEAGSL